MNKCRGQPTCLIINLSLFIYISCKLKHFLYEITIKKAIWLFHFHLAQHYKTNSMKLETKPVISKQSISTSCLLYITPLAGLNQERAKFVFFFLIFFRNEQILKACPNIFHKQSYWSQKSAAWSQQPRKDYTKGSGYGTASHNAVQIKCWVCQSSSTNVVAWRWCLCLQCQ